MSQVDKYGVELRSIDGFEYGDISYDFKEDLRSDGSYRWNQNTLYAPSSVVTGYFFIKSKKPNGKLYKTDEISAKLGGGIHTGKAGSNQSKLARCYDIAITFEGDRIRIRKEFPHPVYNPKNGVPTTVHLGSLQDKWIGYKAYKLNEDDGNVLLILELDLDPFNDDGTPKNNWQEVWRTIDSGQIFEEPWLTPFDKNNYQNTWRIDSMKNGRIEWKFLSNAILNATGGPKKPKAEITPTTFSVTTAGQNVSFANTSSNYTSFSWHQSSGTPSVTFNTTADGSLTFSYGDKTWTDLTFTLGVSNDQGSSEATATVINNISKPADEFDEHGVRMLHKATGKFVDMEVGGDPAGNGQRYNVNHQFLNYMMIGYYKIGKGQQVLETKGDGPNHGGCTKGSDCCWWEADCDLGGGKMAFRASSEWPHPKNHPTPKDMPGIHKTIDFESHGKFVGYSVCLFDNGDGFRRMQQYVDIDPFDETGKPKNNWQLVFDDVDTGNYTSPTLAKRKIPIDHVKSSSQKGLECEIRMHKTQANDGKPNGTAMKFARVYELVAPVV